ncbi:MAG: ABC transporter permease, partial [Acidobacteriaceae bacterium]|nr:ABC transporter permease [Acidobacteriaceae bacterium]
MESFLKDLNYLLRASLRVPTFTVTAMAVLALGIGANTAIFSVVNAVLLKPLRAPQPDRVIAFMSTSREGSSFAASEIKFNLWREQTSLFQDVSGYYAGSLNLTNVDQPQRAVALFVTTDYFRLFGLPIAYGRGFTAEEEQPNGSNAVILSDAFWKRAFGGNSRILGRTVSLSGASYQVVGITAPGIQTETLEPPDIWAPFAIDPNSTNQGHYFQAVGRLKPGIRLAMANAHLQLTTREFYRKFPDSLSTSRRDVFSVELMRDVVVKHVRSSLLILSGAVSLVLLVACVNVANLLLIRASARHREIAIRFAVGASSGRIVRQLLTESVLLALASGVLGLALGRAGIYALLALAPSDLPRVGIKGANVTLDWRVVAFTMLLALVTGLVFGLIPALQALRADLNTALKAHLETRLGRSLVSLRSMFVVAEMSLALVLLIGAALLIRTLLALHSVNPGFDPSNVITTHTSLDPRTARRTGVDAIVRDVFRRLDALPGVGSAGFTRLLPLEGGFNSLPIVIAGRPLTGPSHGSARWMVVSSSYFNVLKVPLVRGRLFSDTDRLGAPGVAIINEAMAHELWPHDPLGRAPLQERLFIGKGLPNF